MSDGIPEGMSQDEFDAKMLEIGNLVMPREYSQYGEVGFIDVNAFYGKSILVSTPLNNESLYGKFKSKYDDALDALAWVSNGFK